MRPLIAANWKLHKTVEESVNTAARLKVILEGLDDRDILLCPPFTALEEVHHVVNGTNLMLGAQDVFWEEEGAFTGEVSPEMLKNVGCEFVIIGHSERELEQGLKDVKKQDMNLVAIAYEPIWAIGTGKTALPKEAQEMHAFIRKTLSWIFDQETADSVRILYGGSVKPGNVQELMAQDDINGALVGGASLDAETFGKVVKGF